MKKGNLRTFLILVLVYLVSACKPEPGAWIPILYDIDADMVSNSPSTGSIGIVHSFGKTISYVSDLGNTPQSQILLPDLQERIASICLSDSVWVITYSSKIAHYNSETRSWVFQSQWGGAKSFPGCYVSHHNMLVFWTANLLMYYDEFWIQVQLPDGEEIRDVSSSQQGVFWVLTFSGKIYKVKDLRWNIIKESEYPNTWSLASFSDGSLWLEIGNSIYKWDPDDGSNPQLILDLDRGEYVKSIFEDRQGTSWIVTSRKVWFYRNGQLIEVELPLNLYEKFRILQAQYRNTGADTRVFGASFDFDKDRLYIILNQKLFYINIQDIYNSK